MEEQFILTVQHKGKERYFKAQLQRYGYIYRFRVDAEGVEVFFERDGEGNYRSVLPFETDHKEVDKLDNELLEAIAQKIEAILV